MIRALLTSTIAALALAAPAVAAPDPERALDTPVGTSGRPLVGTDATAMFKSIGKAGGRITTTEVQVVGGKPRYAIGYVANTGAQRRTWWWDPQVSEATLLKRLEARNARPIDLEVYVIDGKRRLSAVSVANTGPSAKTWWWHARRKRGDLLKLTEQHQSRIVDLERSPSGLYDIVTIANSGEDARAWWLLFDQNHTTIRHAATTRNARFQDLEHTGKSYFFDLVLVQEERPRGWFFNVSDTGTEATDATRSFGARPAIIDFYVAPTGKRTLAHVGVTDVNRATETVRAKLLGDSTEFGVAGTMGLLASGLGGVPPLVAQNPALPHETASALKALHHAAITRIYEQKGLPLEKAADFSYRQYIGLPSCPLDNIMSKPIVQRSLGTAAIDMLRSSDNGATEAILARVGGRAALLSYAKSLGLTGVRLGKPIGCFDRTAPNLWTLNDAGRLWANIASQQVATKEPYLTHLLTSPIDGSAAKRSVWRSAALAAGRPDLAELDDRVEWRTKGGGYGGGAGTVATDAGVLWLPAHGPGGQVVRRPYVLAMFFDTLGSSLPSSFKDVTTELARAPVAEALATFPPAG